MTQAAFTSRYIPTADGLKLHLRDYGGVSSSTPPVVCLPGLSRTTADFAILAEALAAMDGRRVLVIDARGRGLSDRDPDPRNYNPAIESGDVLTALAAMGVAEAIFVGTSRGGIVTMLLAPHHPELIRGVVLNDIGPVLERAGLERIRGYVGKLPQPRSWDEAVAVLKRIAGRDFTALRDADWLHYAHLTFRDEDGRFAPVYDPALMHNVAAMDLDDIPTLWPQFEALGGVPVLVVRGENSDLLSVATAAEMRRRHPDCTLLSVPGQGHAPFLTDAPTVAAIRDFVARCSRSPRAPACPRP
ncbi:MAG TPA: alpha/beta hydrolase [Lichenihabitans sp.]|jgi:pimeloyl-ACP methyl ester carboxylesterase|nr:alpha/beta hydrolase [Lichenihabitans sp.]